MHRIAACCLAAVIASSLALPLRAAPTCERWAGAGRPAAHAGTLAVEKTDELVTLKFDLSALPAEGPIYAAWLYLDTDGEQPDEPIEVFAVPAGAADGDPAGQVAALRRGGKRLPLDPPWCRRLVATDAVRAWAADPVSNRGLDVIPFPGFRPENAFLEIFYDGNASGLPPQATGLRAVHHDGQTFLVWTEHAAYRPRPEEVLWLEKFSENGDVRAAGQGDGAYGMPNHPGVSLRTLRRLQGLGLRDQPSGFQGIKPLKRVAETLPVAYRVYRHRQRITAANVRQAELLATVGPLSGYDDEVYRIHFKGEFLDQWEDPDSFIPTHCTSRGRALRPGEALYVHTPPAGGPAYYAVTTVLAGTENLAGLGDANSLAAPVDERPGRPQPALQWIQEDRYRPETTEYWYRLWAAPPLVNLPSRSLRIGLAVADDYAGPGPLEIDTISDAFNVRESIRVPKPDRVTLAVQRQLAWMPALFYNEGRGTLRAKTECRVDYFSERYMDFVIKWVLANHRIDRSKVEGSLLYFGLRHPEIFPRMSFGTYTATYDYRWAPGSPAHLGPQGIRTVDGEDAWEMYSVGGYVLSYPGRDIPFLVCISGTGKDRGHTSEFGWQDDPRGWKALLAARQPFAAAWSTKLPGEVAQGLGRLRWDTSIPAFSNCSLDNNPGNGDPADGDYYGQINGYLLWDDADVVDRPGGWEMTVYVTSDCPRDRCTVDLTPRHCAGFRPRPGERLRWTSASLADGKVVQSGALAADEHGLATIVGLAVSKGRNRVRIETTDGG